MYEKKIQYILYNYNYYKDEILSCREQLLELEELDGVGAVRFDTVSVAGNGSKVERCILLKEKKKTLLNYRIERLTRRLEKIDDILDMMLPIHAQLLKYRYIEGLSDDTVRKKLNLKSKEYRLQHTLALSWFTRSYDAGFGIARDEDEEDREQMLSKELEEA